MNTVINLLFECSNCSDCYLKYDCPESRDVTKK